MAHTLGPWAYVPRHIAESEPEVRAPEGWLICCTAGDDDARLIAAAPDLLEALKAVTEMLEDAYAGDEQDEAVARAYGVTDAVKSARAAIAKATGEPS